MGVEIKKERNGNVLTIYLSGRVAVKEAEELGKVVRSELDGITDLIFDLEELSYITSAGLRVFLMGQSSMDEVEGKMKLIHVSKLVRDLLDMTRFSDFMKIEE